MSVLFRFLLRNFALGFCLGLGVVALIFQLDLLDIDGLFAEREKPGALATFAGLMGVTFGVVQTVFALATASGADAPLRRRSSMKSGETRRDLSGSRGTGSRDAA